MPKQGPEYRFRTRLCRRFDWSGYVAVKCAGSRPFDLIVMKGGYVAAVELKVLAVNLLEGDLSERALQMLKEVLEAYLVVE